MKTVIYKNGVLLMCLSFLIYLNSCSNEEVDNDKLETNNIEALESRLSLDEMDKLYNSIIQIQDLDEQRLVASALISEDKYSLWQCKLNNFISKNNLNVTQIQFINDLKADLKEEIFVENSIARKSFILNKKEFYMTKAKSLFGDKEGWYLLTKVENINHSLSKISAGGGGPGGGPISACNCEDDGECVRLTGVSWVGLSWEYGTCANSTCYVESYFGIWESDNDGKCSY